jgi:transcription elongation factor Elf1
MTIREKIKCSICEQDYLLRISLGHSETQIHTFECKECGSNISIEVLINFENINWQINYKENSNRTHFKDTLFEEENQRYIVMNLHPELLVPNEFLHNPVYSTNIFESERIQKERFEREKFSKMSFEEFEENYKLSQMYTSNLANIEKNWLILKVLWKMINNNNKKEHLIKKQIKKYKSNTIDSTHADFKEILFDFNNTILYPDFIQKSPDFFKLFKNSIKIHNSENYKKFITFYKYSFFNENMKKNFDIYSNFFDIYNEFKQLLLYVTTSQNIPIGHRVSSHDFEKTKLFYGQLYEAYTSNISLISMLHNLYQGREYDQFQNMTLQKYLTLDKSGKTDNFANTKEFDWFSEFVSSKLRNASHHGNIELEGDIVVYKAGKSLNKYTMSYTRYLEICIQLFIRFVSLNQLSLLLIYIEENKSL